MSIMNYWPSLENIEQCIRKEAEELQDDVLLAVHEKMALIRRDVNNNQEILQDEDLFDQLLTTERAIPLIGDSGMGKSHLVRWLDCRLKSYPRRKVSLHSGKLFVFRKTPACAKCCY